MTTNQTISFRPTDADMANIAAIIADVAAQGYRINRTGAISAALADKAKRIREKESEMKSYPNLNGRDGFPANTMSAAARKACKERHFTPTNWEPLNAGRDYGEPEEFPVMRIWNSQREIVLTNKDLTQ